MADCKKPQFECHEYVASAAIPSRASHVVDTEKQKTEEELAKELEMLKQENEKLCAAAWQGMLRIQFSCLSNSFLLSVQFLASDTSFCSFISCSSFFSDFLGDLEAVKKQLKVKGIERVINIPNSRGNSRRF